jgi:hypothetical protein
MVCFYTGISTNSRRRIVSHMKTVTAVSVIAGTTLAMCGWLGSRAARATALPTLKSSRLLIHGRVRCTATVAAEVQAGQPVEVRYVLRNVSKHPVKISLWVFSTGAVLKAADGTVYDTSAPSEALPGIPPPTPRKLRPGKTIRLGPLDIPVRWNGPLQVIPSCLGKWLPPFRVGVVATSPPPDAIAAVGAVVAAADHLLDRCRPQSPGVPVTGQIDPSSGTSPPMDAECSISVSSEGPFLVAQALVLIPADLSGVQIFQPYETLWPVDRFVALAAAPPYEAIAWEFVVTGTSAIPVAAATLAATNDSARSAPFFAWNGTGWDQDGEGSCGGESFAAGGTGPSIDIISACS